MSANKLRIVQENKFPFDIVIMDGEEVYLTERRYAWSSSQKTLQECLAGIGMGDNKDDAIRGNTKQLEKFEEIVNCINNDRSIRDHYHKFNSFSQSFLQISKDKFHADKIDDNRQS